MKLYLIKILKCPIWLGWTINTLGKNLSPNHPIKALLSSLIVLRLIPGSVQALQLDRKQKPNNEVILNIPFRWLEEDNICSTLCVFQKRTKPGFPDDCWSKQTVFKFLDQICFILKQYTSIWYPQICLEIMCHYVENWELFVQFKFT